MARKLKWISVVFVSAFVGAIDMALLNWLSYRQTLYTLPPLPDATDQMDNDVDVLAVDVFTGVWAFVTSCLWLCKSRKLQFLSELLLAELVLTTFGTVMHAFTVIPDPVESCVQTSQANWARIGGFCGTGLWSFTIMHFVLFYKLAEQSCNSYVFSVVGFALCISCSMLAVFSNHCYTTAAFVTVFVSLFVCTHRTVARLARSVFTRHVSMGPNEEVYPLNRTI